MKNWKTEPWRLVVGVISILFIVVMWAKKDITSIYATAPKDQILPMIVTALAVSLVKVALIAGLVFLAKWLIGKFIPKNK